LPAEATAAAAEATAAAAEATTAAAKTSAASAAAAAADTTATATAATAGAKAKAANALQTLNERVRIDFEQAHVQSRVFRGFQGKNDRVIFNRVFYWPVCDLGDGVEGLMQSNARQGGMTLIVV